MYKKFLTWLLACTLLLSLLLTGCTNTQSKRTLKLTGKLTAPTFAITAPRPGKILGLISEKGERIRKGQPLFAIPQAGDNEAIDQATAELTRAQSQLQNATGGNNAGAIASANYALQSALSQVATAQQNYAKMNKLYSVGGVSRQKLEQAQTALSYAQESVEAAREQQARATAQPTQEEIADLQQQVNTLKAAYDKALEGQTGSEILSPSTCIVQEVLLKNGTEAAEGQNVMTLQSLTDCSIEARASGSSTAALVPDTPVSITHSTLKKPFTGVIKSVKDGMVSISSSAKPEDLPDGAEVEIIIEIQ